MNYFIKGKTSISLSQNDFIASGGQAKIFGKGGTIYKIYDNPSAIIPDGKLRELKMITHPNIIVPQDIILDDKNNKCGLTMEWVKNTTPLCKLFTNDFRKRKAIDNNKIIELVDNIRCIIVAVHRSNCLIVDGNELNYIVKDDFTNVYSIDTDSFQTRTYPATAIMPSIKDYQSDKFTENTDWFSFAIIACQLFVGIHPFKGIHPQYKSANLEQRILANVSIFNKDTKVPRIVRDFSLIPKNYYDWFLALFEDGKRLPAPDIAGPLTITLKQVSISISNTIIISLIKEYKNDILYHNINNGSQIIKTKDKICIDDRAYPISIDEELLITSRKNIPILVKIENNKLSFRSLRNDIDLMPITITCTDKMVIDNIVYLKNRGNLLEIEFNDMGQKVIPSIKNVWKIAANSSEFFSSVIYQNILGVVYLVIPKPCNNEPSSCLYKRFTILDGYKIIDAKYSNNVACLIGFKENRYDKIIIRFSKSHMQYDCRIIDDIIYKEINFVVKDNGIVIMINDEDNIDIFRNIPFDPDINSLTDLQLPLPMKLSKDGNTVLFFKDDKLNEMKLK